MLLLFFRSTSTPPPNPDPIVLPVAPHTYRSARRYLAERINVVTEKDPIDTTDYELNWAAILGSDTISSSLWVVPSGITGVSASNTTTTTTIFVSGGTSGIDYAVSNKIITTDGRIFERTIIIPVRNL